MSPVGPDAGAVSTQLNLEPGMVVQELGWDDDADDALRQAIMEAIDGDLVEEPDDAVDAVLLWVRQDDGDVVDLLIDALTDLSPTGFIWVLSPKVGREGHLSQADLSEGALAGGLALTTSASVSREWSAHKIVRPKGGRR